MKLLIALLFILPFSVQAKHHQHKNHKNHKHHKYCKKHKNKKHCKYHKKNWRHRFYHNNQHYLTVGSIFNFVQKTNTDAASKASTKLNTYSIKIGKGVIFKKKYDVQIALGYDKKQTNTVFSYGLYTNYVLDKVLAKYKNTIGTHKPYIGLGLRASQIKDTKSKAKTHTKFMGFQVGDRVLISKNMMMGLEYSNFKGTKADKTKITNTGFAMSWNYFF